jgi:hypothetical protein
MVSINDVSAQSNQAKNHNFELHNIAEAGNQNEYLINEDSFYDRNITFTLSQ